MENATKINRSEKIRDNVFGFYAENKEFCDYNYKLAEDENIDKIYDDVENEVEINSLLTKTSIVLLTANKYEKNILHQRIHSLSAKPIRRMEIDLLCACERFNKVFAYWFKWSGYSVLHIHANVTGSYTIGGSADIVRWILSNKYLFPTAIISFGICFGTKENESILGDVIISKKIYPYFVGVKVKDETLTVVDDNVFSINSGLYSQIRKLKENNKFNSLGFKVEFDNYITGEAVVSSSKARNQFVRTTTQNILAGDMEGYGLFKESNSLNNKIPCLIIKSICDWGTEKNFDEKDEKILNQFKNKIHITFSAPSNNDSSAEYILKTLKDRIQAFSASCAFDALNIIMKNNVFETSILDHIREWINAHTGAATTCKMIQEAACNIMDKLEYQASMSKHFIHRSIMILAEEGLLQCEKSCITYSYNHDGCINIKKDESIYINKKENNECMSQI